MVSDKRLDSPSIPITSSAAQLTFRNNYNLEASPPSFFDGGVLEISIGGGAFTDIIAAGGSFVAGGYTGTISTGFSNPLAGRQAWSGNSAGFITTTVNLPAAAAGQNIVLRWRMGSDTQYRGGWLENRQRRGFPARGLPGGNAYAKPDTYSYGNSDRDSNADSDCHRYSHLYADGHGDVYAYTYGHSNVHAYTYCACYSNTYADLRPCRLAIGSAPASGTLCDPGCARYRQ